LKFNKATLIPSAAKNPRIGCANLIATIRVGDRNIFAQVFSARCQADRRGAAKDHEPNASAIDRSKTRSFLGKHPARLIITMIAASRP